MIRNIDRFKNSRIKKIRLTSSVSNINFIDKIDSEPGSKVLKALGIKASKRSKKNSKNIKFRRVFLRGNELIERDINNVERVIQKIEKLDTSLPLKFDI